MLSKNNKMAAILIILILTCLTSGCFSASAKTNSSKELKNNNPVKDIQEAIDKSKDNQKKIAIANFFKKTNKDKIAIYKIIDYTIVKSDQELPYGVITYKDEYDTLQLKTIRGNDTYILEDIYSIKGSYLLIKAVGNDTFQYIVSEKSKEQILKDK